MVRYKRHHIAGRPECDKYPILDNDDNELIRNDGSSIEFRGMLRVDLNKSEDARKNVHVIMMNPSAADSDESDGTINKVIKFFVEGYDEEGYESSYQEIIDSIKYLNVFNILPIYNPNNDVLFDDFNTIISECGKGYLEALLEENIQRIIETLKDDSTDYIVLAWGGISDGFPFTLYYHLVCKVLDSLITSEKELFVFKTKSFAREDQDTLTLQFNPRHPRGCNLYDLVPVEVQSLYRIIPLEP
ncbi:DUF1643 domain-containing protein [Niallia taxi]|uniref:DUF1643 domain-containing protein n=1 Tax=Niallia taxi TaxID=2499688 RepID=UPI0015F572E2|nr:DUF1643 domain-containing protein [Niallia taxi]